MIALSGVRSSWRHVGQELATCAGWPPRAARLVSAISCEQPRVLDRQRRLVGERLEQRRPSPAGNAPGACRRTTSAPTISLARAAAARASSARKPARSGAPRARGSGRLVRAGRRPGPAAARPRPGRPASRPAGRGRRSDRLDQLGAHPVRWRAGRTARTPRRTRRSRPPSAPASWTACADDGASAPAAGRASR